MFGALLGPEQSNEAAEALSEVGQPTDGRIFHSGIFLSLTCAILFLQGTGLVARPVFRKAKAFLRRETFLFSNVYFILAPGISSLNRVTLE